MAQQICKGDGSCLEQAGFMNGYKKFDDVECNHNCQPIKCPNYLVCEHLEPQWLLWCHKGVCMSPCGVLFNNTQLQFTENKECPVCLEIKTCVKQLKCIHSICIDCFKRCHLPPYWNDPQPQFPYSSEIEDDYENTINDLRWKNDPLIQKYHEDWDKWELERTMKESSESYLKVCPICRS
jgi:hypothetical protein